MTSRATTTMAGPLPFLAAGEPTPCMRAVETFDLAAQIVVDTARGRGHSSDAVTAVNDAKRLCHACPVIDACRTYAITNGERTGIWGGMRPDERARFARRHHIPVGTPHCASCGHATRHRNAKAADHPGTVIYYSRGMCYSCARGGAPC